MMERGPPGPEASKNGATPAFGGPPWTRPGGRPLCWVAMAEPATPNPTPIGPRNATARAEPLQCYDTHDGKHVQVLYARELVGGDKGQLPRAVELVLVEHEIPAEADGWLELELAHGREVMAQRYAMVRRVTAKAK